MSLRARILAVTRETGPRSINVLRGLARTDRQKAAFDRIFRAMLDAGELVMHSDKRWAKYGPGKQRGFGLVEGLIALGAVATLVGAVWGFLAWHASTHYQRGVDATMVKWAKANVDAEAAKRKRDDAVAVALAEAERGKLDLEARAGQAERRWREADRESKRKGTALATCESGNPERAGPLGADRGAAEASGPAAPGSGDPAPAAAPRVRLTWEFVHLYDTAWTGLDGKPLPEAAAWDPGAELASASPYTPGDVIDVHGENSRACSRDRRELAALIARIQLAADAADRANKESQ